MLIHDVAQYVRQTLPRPQFYIQDILPKQGVMLLYGNPKVKKSWLCQYMAFCISTGMECLSFRTEQVRTLLAQFEISPVSYGIRLQDMARHFELQDMMLYETSPMLMYLDDDRNFQMFMDDIRPINPKVIFLDCMAACFGGDENNGESVASFIEKLSIMKTEFEASIVLIHHTNKNLLSSNSTDRARGHSRLTGWVDTLCYMAEQPNGVQLQIKARQATRDVPNINIRFNNYLWNVL